MSNKETLYRCKGCGHLYQRKDVDCDCHLPGQNDYEELTAAPGDLYFRELHDALIELDVADRIIANIEKRIEELSADLEKCRGVLKAFGEYVHGEQCATDGPVTYTTTAINHWAFLARDAVKGKS